MSAVQKSAKASLYIVSALVALVVIGAIYIYMNMNTIGKDLAEKYASDALGVKVRIGDLNVSMGSKSVVVKDVTVANPKGYSKPHVFTVSEIKIGVNSVSQELISFKDIAVNGANIYLEVKEDGSNIGALKKNAQKEIAEEQSAAEQNQIKVIVEQLVMQGAMLHPSTILVQKELKTIKVPDVRVRNIGRRSNGVVASDAVAQVMNQILKDVSRAAYNVGFFEGLGAEALVDVGVRGLDIFNRNAQEVIDKKVDAVEKGVDQLKQMLGGDAEESEASEEGAE